MLDPAGVYQRLKPGLALKPDGERWRACCPFHEDKTPSFIVFPDGGHNCFGCGVTGDAFDFAKRVNRDGSFKRALKRVADAAGVQLTTPQHNGRLTVEALAQAKKLPVDFVKRIGWRQSDGYVLMVYQDVDGKPARPRARKKLKASTDGSVWWAGSKEQQIVCYGAHMLKEWQSQGKRTLWLVEGETDSATLWLHDLAGLGVPGKENAKTLKPLAKTIGTFDEICVSIEGDGGAGEQFGRNVCDVLKDAGVDPSQVRLVRFPGDGAKDPNDLHKKDTEGFVGELGALVAQSPRLAEWPEPEAKQATRASGTEPDDLMDGRTFIPRRAAEWLLSQGEWLTVSGQLMQYETGVFVEAEPGARKLLVDKLGDDWRVNREKEAITLLKTMTHTESADTNLHEREALCNVANGMLVVEKRELLPHDPKYKATRQFPVMFDMEPCSEELDGFLCQTLGSDDAVQTFLDWLGSLLLPPRTRRRIVLLVGEPDTGKTTLLKVIQAFVGERHCSNLALTDICDYRFGVADLEHVVLNAYDDLPLRPLKYSGRLKAITGGASVRGERKFDRGFTFTPIARFLFTANALPELREFDEALGERLLIITCPNRVEEAKRDTGLCARLTQTEALSGLLNMALVAWRRCHERGGQIQIPDSMRQAIEDYRERSDSVLAFVRSRCELGPSESVGKALLYRTYKAWCEQNRRIPVSDKLFPRRLDQTFDVDEARPDGGIRQWIGIGLLPALPGSPCT